MKKNIAEWFIFFIGVAIIVYILTTQDVSRPIPAIIIAIIANVISIPLYVGIIEGIYSLRKLPF